MYFIYIYLYVRQKAGQNWLPCFEGTNKLQFFFLQNLFLGTPSKICCWLGYNINYFNNCFLSAAKFGESNKSIWMQYSRCRFWERCNHEKNVKFVAGL